jgi:hypothetical protein
MVGNHSNGGAGLVVLVIQEVFKIFPGFATKGHRHTRDFRIDAMNGCHNRVIDARISLRRHAMFTIDFVQDFPIVDLEVMAGVVARAEFVSKSTLCIPIH